MPTRRTVLAALAAGLGGCVTDGDGTIEQATTPAPTVAGTATPSIPAGTYHYTHPQPTGNRRLSGGAPIRSAPAVTFRPEGRPQWLVAHPAKAGSHWTVATRDGVVTTWHVADGRATRRASHGSVPPETQPVVAATASGTLLLTPPGGMAARTSPLVDRGGPATPPRLVSVAGDGDLVVAGPETRRLAADALRDGRLAALGDGRYAVFCEPTDRYRHGALGDAVEATTLLAADARAGTIEARTTLDPPLVFEGLQPLVADLDGDGTREVVTTVADSTDGARIAVFSPSGERLATGPVHEPGWRHQLAVAPFGPDGHPELAVVRKPHVDRLLEFYRLDGGLSIRATAEGISSHTYGSRVLGGGVAADLDADGAVELLAPTADREALAAVRRGQDGAGIVWQLGLDGPLQSNVTGTGLPGDSLAVGAASDGAVHVWQA